MGGKRTRAYTMLLTSFSREGLLLCAGGLLGFLMTYHPVKNKLEEVIDLLERDDNRYTPLERYTLSRKPLYQRIGARVTRLVTNPLSMEGELIPGFGIPISIIRGIQKKTIIPLEGRRLSWMTYQATTSSALILAIRLL